MSESKYRTFSILRNKSLFTPKMIKNKVKRMRNISMHIYMRIYFKLN